VQVLPLLLSGALWRPGLVYPLSVFVLGASMNMFFLSVLWHWYWHVETLIPPPSKQQANSEHTQQSATSPTQSTHVIMHNQSNVDTLDDSSDDNYSSNVYNV
jgi:hypothetical protein